jgi:CRISPR/Cas system CSM-associated protein Csm3 (group 7 of RAMP superfamily)
MNMNTRKTYVLDGFITAQSPIAIRPHNLQAIKRILPCAVYPVAGVPRVCIPSTTLRGRIRRAAVDVFLDGRIPELKDRFRLTIGGIKDTKRAAEKDDEGENMEEEGSRSEDAVEETKEASSEAKSKEATMEKRKETVKAISAIRHARLNNPLISLFGVMDPVNVQGLAMVGTAVATEPVAPVVFAHVRVDDIARDGVDETYGEDASEAYAEMKHAMDATSVLKAEHEKLKKELSALKRKKGDPAQIEALDAKVKEAQKKKDDAKTNGTSTVQIQQMLQYQAAPSGTEFSQRIVLRHVTEEEAALFLKALALVGEDPVIGGKLAHGCGLYSGSWTLKVKEGGRMAHGGSIRFSDDFAGASSDGLAADLIARNIDWSRYDIGLTAAE